MQQFTNNGMSWFSYIENDSITAGFSTLKGGFSCGTYSGLNIGLNTADDNTIISKNRHLLFGTIAPEMDVLYLNQTHSNSVFDADDLSFFNFCDGDGLFSRSKNKLLCITIADCGSVLFFDPDYSIIGAVHCGWKGTLNGVIENIIEEISKQTCISNLTACIGPMIRQENYSVGHEFTTYFDAKYFKEFSGALKFDLNAVIHDKLRLGGISNIIDCGFDTYSNPDLFYSHRRNSLSGRMCAFIGLK